MVEIVGTLKPPRQSAPPSSPVGGQIYYDTDDNQLYYWNGTTWITGLTGPPGPAGTVYDSDQVGTIKAYSGATVPTNWMLADGRSLPTASYPDLFAAIGYTYGGSGANFNLPDLRSKIIYGISVAGDLGASGGASAVTLDLTQIPSHNHGGVSTGADRSLATTSGAADRALGTNTTGSHKHFPTTVGQFYATTGLNLYNPGSGGTGRYLVTGGEDMTLAGDHSHTVTDHLHSVPGVDHLHGINSAGGGLSHENMPPYVRLAHIIKVIGAAINPGGALVGATGAKGDPGPWRGAWSAAASYAVGDSVSYFDGQVTGSYRRKVAGTTAGTPKADTTNWEIIASGGSIGVDGIPGTVPVYEQASQPSDTTTGALWIDTDDVAPTWPVGPPLVTSLPTNPVDGQEVYYLADAANGVMWRLRYRAASASIYKWEVIGGAPLYVEITTQESTASITYVGLTTAGPSIALPLAGDYIVEQGLGGYNNAASAWADYMSYDIGGTAAADADAVTLGSNVSTVGQGNAARARRKNGLGAVTLTSKYKVSGGTGTYNNRWMRVTPVRVG